LQFHNKGAGLSLCPFLFLVLLALVLICHSGLPGIFPFKDYAVFSTQIPVEPFLFEALDSLFFPFTAES